MNNAFYDDVRSCVLSAVRIKMMMTVIIMIKIYAFCHSAYSQSSTLFYGPFRVLSQVDPQQGDPVGPLWFCNSVQPLLNSMESLLTLGGPA